MTRAVLAVALGMSALVIGGLVVQVFLGLDRAVFALLVLALAAAAVRARRRLFPALGARRPARPRIGLAGLAATAAAAALAAWAISTAVAGADRQLGEARFSSLWVVPQGPPGEPPSGPPLTLGVFNHEGRALGYRLDLRRGAATVRSWSFRLAANRSWEAGLAGTAARGALVGWLYCDGLPCRRVALEIGGGA